MKQTANYKLSQWEGTDRILMEDFNGDNAKIEAALKAQADTLAAHGTSLDAMKTHAATLSSHTSSLAALNTAVSKRGNCQVQFITYQGTGKGIQSSPKTMTFSHRPVAIFLTSSDYHSVMAAYGCKTAYLVAKYDYPVTFTWNNRSVSWYGDNFTIGMDDPTLTYLGIALLEIQ